MLIIIPKGHCCAINALGFFKEILYPVNESLDFLMGRIVYNIQFLLQLLSINVGKER